MNQSINTDSKNSKEPQQKYRLGTVSIKKLGGLNRFYGKTVSLEMLYNECGWDSLALRRNNQKLKFIYKATHDMVPSQT